MTLTSIFLSRGEFCKGGEADISLQLRLSIAKAKIFLNKNTRNEAEHVFLITLVPGILLLHDFQALVVANVCWNLLTSSIGMSRVVLCFTTKESKGARKLCVWLSIMQFWQGVLSVGDVYHNNVAFLLDKKAVFSNVRLFFQMRGSLPGFRVSVFVHRGDGDALSFQKKT